MGWAVGWDANTGRWRGYGVPSYCEEPGCVEEINRGLAYACGGLDGCGRFFCGDHLYYDYPEDHDEDCGCGKDHSGDSDEGNEAVCKRCLNGEDPCPLKPEHPKWVEHILTDESWAQWREEEPERVLEYAAKHLSKGRRLAPEQRRRRQMVKVYTPYTLGRLLEEAKNNPDKVFGLEPWLDSYRGYYEHVAMEDEGHTTGNQLAAMIRGRLGTTMHGYKGGDYLVHERCQVFLAGYGHTGPMLVGFTDDGEPIGCYESRMV